MQPKPQQSNGFSRTEWMVLIFLPIILLYCNVSRADRFDLGLIALQRGDFAEAFCIWNPLAVEGHKDAAYNLGWLYANGNGLSVDIEKAISWWKRAAERGHHDAQFAIGLAYTAGEGVKKDEREALYWYLIAARGGHKDAREYIRNLLQTNQWSEENGLEKILSEPWIGETIGVKVERANLRSGPGTDYSLVATVESGAAMITLGNSGDWVQVIVRETLARGWMAGWLVEAQAGDGNSDMTRNSYPK